MKRHGIVSGLSTLACLIGYASDPAWAAGSRGFEQSNAKSLTATLQELNNGTVPTYKVGWFDLNTDSRKEAVVLMMGADWCGSGGCTLFVLRSRASSWEVVSKTPTIRLPVSVLPSRTNGWRDMVVVNQGGGNHVAVQTRLEFFHGSYVKVAGRVPKAGRVPLIR